MRKLTGTRTVNCDVETYWEIYCDEKFTAELHQDLGTRSLEVLERTDTLRRLKVAPKLDLPKAVQKILGPSFEYEEQAELDRDASTWRWKIIPSTLADKVSTGGHFRVEPAGEGKCKRIDEATIEAKVFGVGKLLESTTEKQVEATWDAEVAAVNRWAAKRA
ncbi:MAG: DUF2505 family protein [Deltaproteobacteria bacterium]|jgi:hypothetical protein|nr:DUF2505 family protein [Deltaproteobacteria bacterium]MBW2531135.1 DUF2505 family protein [Deltaproteobacteria bacterium]